MTTSVESAAREHEILEYSGRKWVTVETAAAYATSERSRVIRSLAQKAEQEAHAAFERDDIDEQVSCEHTAAWLRSQEG